MVMETETKRSHRAAARRSAVRLSDRARRVPLGIYVGAERPQPGLAQAVEQLGKPGSTPDSLQPGDGQMVKCNLRLLLPAVQQRCLQTVERSVLRFVNLG